ncbi:TrkH family potassium uptake protein [Chamaesiphon minutus]|uniref:Potassium uptake protein, TrkH family n=1 Tax=Chamaesiphon minutus (strain ATCC 27169 / PCC 6605) TaxID=1173020 RepID=K9UA89_CHAP6|nr:TrkH family potassium uptake protein [Chamaesiphon minutus]AFY91745.1 potassium uptake protein, TrkH family [Chamaesiphon minutus PCC 6605]
MTVSRSICLGFMAVISFGALLLMLPISTSNGQWNDPIVALFTATSAVCVTGHVVVDTATYFSRLGQLAILLLIQVGGLGYMTVTTFLLLLLGRRFGLKDKVAIQQSLDRRSLQGSTQILQSIVATTMLFELTGAFLLLLVFVPDLGWQKGLWFALFHSISAWNNAGFGLFSDNLVGYQGSWLVNGVITGLIIFGGIGYEVILELYLRGRARLQCQRSGISRSLNFQVAVSTTLFLLLGGTLAIWAIEIRNPQTLGALSFPQQVLAAWFQSVTSRTAGFNTIDISKMTTAGLFVTIALMLVGGSPGGTAGGIKTTTARLLASCTYAILRGKESVILYRRQVPNSLLLKAIAVTFGSLLTVVFATMAIALADPKLDFIRILFEVVSAFATVGLSTGITAGLTPFSKLVLIATMYIGRVGILLLIAALLGDPRTTTVKYPEESLLVG